MRNPYPKRVLGSLVAAGAALLSTSALAGDRTWDFTTDPTLDTTLLIQASENAAPLWYDTDGNSGGFLCLTHPIDSLNAGIVFPDIDDGKVVTAFSFSCDLRIGNPDGTRAADGFSISLARDGDPAIANPGAYASYAGGVPEAGATTGLAICFDTWSGNTLPDGADIEGLIVRVDNKTILRQPLLSRNGACDDIESLQTGPRDADFWASIADPYSPESWRSLCWKRFEATLDVNGKLTVVWKGNKVLDGYQTTFFPSKARLILAGRTGGENENTHFDNIHLVTTVSSDTTPPTTPGTPTVTYVGSHRVALQWAASTDDSGRAVYEVERNGTIIATLVQDPTYVDTGVAPNTTYNYRVLASDAAGNKSGFAGPVAATTIQDVESPAYATFQYWKTSPDGTAVSLLTDFADYPNNPHMVSYTPSLDSRPVFPDDSHEQYGGRVLGWLTPVESGDYDFMISSDDASEFWLSTDATAANLVRQCEETGCCEGFKEPEPGVNMETTQAPVPLIAGQKYYFEMLWKEGGGGDYARVAWRRVGNSTPAANLQPIPGVFLSTMADPGGASVNITGQPQSVTLPESSKATFTIVETHTSPVVTAASIQWYQNGSPILGATGASYTTDFLTPSDNGAKYQARVAVPGAFKLSDEATLAVVADTTPPQLNYVSANRTFNGVRVWFNEPVDPTTAQQAGNYTFSGGLTASSATLVGNQIVDVVTSAQIPGTTYDLIVNNVKDASTGGNVIAANSTLPFTAWTQLPGYLQFEHYDALGGAADTDIDTALQDPRVIAHNPTTFGYLAGRFDTRTIFPNDSHENYFARMTGWLTPTETGDYHFFIRSDDASRLFLSTTDAIPDPAVDLPICVEYDCCDGFYEPETGDLSTTATPIHLEAGRHYGILGLLKEGGGGDYMMVAWRKSTDTTAAANLPFLPGQFLSTYVDPNVDVAFTRQPTDQVGVLPSLGIDIVSVDFNSNEAGFTVVNSAPEPPAGFVPWAYDAPTGKWIAVGSPAECGGPYNSRLNSPAYTMPQDGSLSLSFSHRYSFEPDLWDGGQIRISVNGGAFLAVPADSFTENGYANGNLIGNGVLLGQRAFNGDSPGYTAGEFITSKVKLGNLSKNDTVAIQFLGGWDECASGKSPSWVVDSMKMTLLPMIIQDFAKNDGGFTVINSATPPPTGFFPFVYDAAAGQWTADGSHPDCGGPFNSKLTSPAYVVPIADEVTLNFTHRYAFEGDYYDGGAVYISVNGGAYTPVSPDSFTANGYATGNIIGSGILNGKRAFNGDSPGYASGTLITSSVVLGNFNQNDTISVQFVGGWDECWGPATSPDWLIKSLSLVFGKAAKASTFDAEAVASRQGVAEPISFQWQRNDGAGFVNIPNATNPSLQIFPVAADFQATFRLVATVPGKTVISDVVRLLTGDTTPPDISVSVTGGAITITYTGKLQSAPDVNGTYQDVQGATSPYPVPTPGAQGFFRSVK